MKKIPISFHLSLVSSTPVINLDFRISPRFFVKIRNGPLGILKGPEETVSGKKPEVENLVSDFLYHNTNIRLLYTESIETCFGECSASK